MADPRLVRHLKVLTDRADTGPVPATKLFSIGDPAEVEGQGEVVALLSWIDDNLSRYVLANAPSSSWGRGTPPPFVTALPNRAVKKRDAIFLLSAQGQDRDEDNPDGIGRLHFVHLGARDRLWASPGTRIYIYKLEAVQTRTMLAPKK